MLSVLLATALASDPLVLVGKLFPSAKITEVDGQRALAPITRKGQVGFIRADQITMVTLDAGRSLLSFQLDTAAGIDPTPEALTKAASGGHSSWTRILGVVLLDSKGAFVAKPEGYPLEKPVELDCLGDFCELGPRGGLLPVEGSTRFAILKLEPDPESMGSVIPIEVAGDVIRLFEARPHGTSGGLTGCSRTEQWGDFKESKGALKAARMRVCGDGNAEMCAEMCAEAGYPLESTLGPATLSR